MPSPHQAGKMRTKERCSHAARKTSPEMKAEVFFLCCIIGDVWVWMGAPMNCFALCLSDCILTAAITLLYMKEAFALNSL